MAKWLRLPAGVFADTRLALCGDDAALLLCNLLALNEQHGRKGVLTAAESDPLYLARVCRLWVISDRIGELLAVLEREGFIWRENPDAGIQFRPDLVAGKLAPEHSFGTSEPAAP